MSWSHCFNMPLTFARLWSRDHVHLQAKSWLHTLLGHVTVLLICKIPVLYCTDRMCLVLSASYMLQALEYQMQQGVAEAARHDLYLAPLSAQHEYGPELHSNVCVLKLLQPV